MRALLINALYPTPGVPKIVGGAEVFVRGLAESLAAAGVVVEVVRARQSDEPDVEVHNGVAVHSAPVDNLYPPFAERPGAAKRLVWHLLDDWRRAAPFVARRIESFRPDVVHTHTLTGLTTGVWDAAAARGAPVVHTLHDYYLTCPRSIRFARARSCARTCLECRLLTLRRRRACSRIAAVVGVSRRTLAIHEREGLFRDTPIRAVIRPAVERPDAPPLRASLKPPLSIGFIGRLTGEKGVERLVRAAALLPAGSVSLTFAGRASEEMTGRLRALAPSTPMRFLGFVTPSDFYREVDVVAVPSIWEEPAGLVVDEAQAAGRPVLSTRYGGIAEGVIDGVTGWLTNGEVDELAARLAGLVADPSLVARAARECERTRDERSLAAVAGAYRDLLERVARRAPATLRPNACGSRETPDGRSSSARSAPRP